MNKDGVSIAFELIIEELEEVAKDIDSQGSLAFKERRYDAALHLSETGKNLHGFIEKVTGLLDEWQAGIDVNMRQKIHIAKISDKKTNTKSRKTRLKVRLGNGNEIEEYYAADTFALAIKEMGIDTVEALGLTNRGIPLVGSKRSNEYKQRQIDGKYVCVHSSTIEKMETLETIADRLGIKIKVQMIQCEPSNLFTPADGLENACR